MNTHTNTKAITIRHPALALLLALAVPLAFADHHGQGHEAHAAHDAHAAVAAAVPGEIRKVDTEQRKLTIRHEAIPEFSMVAMTMVFRVADAVPLDGLKPGDKVRFRLEKKDGQLVLTALEKAP